MLISRLFISTIDHNRGGFFYVIFEASIPNHCDFMEKIRISFCKCWQNFYIWVKFSFNNYSKAKKERRKGGKLISSEPIHDATDI